MFEEARFHRVSARHLTNSAAAKPLVELRPAPSARCVTDRDGDRLLLADKHDQALAAGHSGVEEVALQHRLVLPELTLPILSGVAEGFGEFLPEFGRNFHAVRVEPGH